MSQTDRIRVDESGYTIEAPCQEDSTRVLFPVDNTIFRKDEMVFKANQCRGCLAKVDVEWNPGEGYSAVISARARIGKCHAPPELQPPIKKFF